MFYISMMIYSENNMKLMWVLLSTFVSANEHTTVIEP